MHSDQSFRTAALVAPLLLAAVVCFATCPAARAAEPSDEESRAERMAWFHDAKFGMFIHWGIYAVPAGEWKGKTHHGEWIMLTGRIPSKRYEQFAKQFNPVKFDAEQWVAIAKQAGMKYMVITSKHHDGFCMYDSKLTEYDIVDATPYGKDPMKPLSRACAKAGLKFCFYYSNVDWHHPQFPAKYAQRGWHGEPNPNADISKYAAYMKGQVRELLTNYGPIGILWFDGGGSFRNAPDRIELLKAKSIVEMIHKLQPNCLINNRLWTGADYGTPEQHIPGGRQQTAFEVCMTLNRHWGYNKHDKDYKTPKTVIRNLADIAGKGGNYLLNVGPTAEGIIPPESVRILREVGKWMKVNGASIYGTTAGPFHKQPKWGRATQKPATGTLYLHVFDWPKDGRLAVPGLTNKVKRAALLADAAAKVKVEQQAGGTVLSLPAEAPDPIDSVIVLDVAGKIDLIVEPIRQRADGTLYVHARDAIVHGTKLQYEKDKRRGLDNLGFWVDETDWAEWRIRMDRAGKFDVTITVATPAAKPQFTLALGDQKLAAHAERTGTYSDFKEQSLGVLDVPEGGAMSLIVRPVAGKWSPINLQAIRLTPRKR